MSTSQTALPRCEEPTSYTSTRVAQASLPHLPAWSPVKKSHTFVRWILTLVEGKGNECKELSGFLGT